MVRFLVLYDTPADAPTFPNRVSSLVFEVEEV